MVHNSKPLFRVFTSLGVVVLFGVTIVRYDVCYATIMYEMKYKKMRNKKKSVLKWERKELKKAQQ